MMSSWSYDLFVFYADADQEWVEGALLPRLELPIERIARKSVDFALGAPLIREFERTIEHSHYILLVLSPDSHVEMWSDFVTELATFVSVEQREDRVIPLLLRPYDLELKLRSRVILDCTDEADQDKEIERLCKRLRIPKRPDEKITCPYPGLEPFSKDFIPYFCGRDDDIRELVQRLEYQRFILVIGPSGCGKSSLVLAGVIPRLERDQNDVWLCTSFQPGRTPLTQLGEALETTIQPTTDYAACVEAVLSDATPRRTRLLLVIDQLEEFVRQTEPQKQADFVAAITSLRSVPNCSMILTVRRDLFNTYPVLRKLGSDTHEEKKELRQLRGSQLRDAIVKPAEHEKVNVRIDRVLVQRLLDDAEDQRGVMPLLQVMMKMLWSMREYRWLSPSAYDRLGTAEQRGLAGALSILADGVLSRLPEDSKDDRRLIALRIFARLTQFGESSNDTNSRRQQSRAELAAGNDLRLFDATLEHLITQRVVIADLDSAGEPDSVPVNVAHDMLITDWSRFREWLDRPFDNDPQRSRRTDELYRRRLEERARSDELLGEKQLHEAQQWLMSGADVVAPSPDVYKLVTASQAEIERERRLRWSLIIGVTLLSTFLTGGLLVPRALAAWWRYQALRLSPAVEVVGSQDEVTFESEYNQQPTAIRAQVAPFTIDLHEVSYAQYCLCRWAGACNVARYDPNQEVCADARRDWPVTYVSLGQATQFCNWLGRRLPTELEWEWAARGPDHRRYPTGDSLPRPKLVNLAPSQGPWPISDVREDRVLGTAIVGMAGNVQEWTNSLWLAYEDRHYGPVEWSGDQHIGAVVRGGSWNSGEARARTSYRDPAEAYLPFEAIGFRCAGDASGGQP